VSRSVRALTRRLLLEALLGITVAGNLVMHAVHLLESRRTARAPARGPRT
jgi:hypothetical protein